MGDSSDGMCVKCHGEAEDGAGGLCAKCRAAPAFSVAKVKAHLLAQGYDVAVPSIDGAQYDLVVRSSSGNWHSMQVKTAYNGTVNTCRTTDKGREPYDIRHVDLFAIVEDDSVYILTIDEVNNGGRMSMNAVRALCSKA